MVEFCQQHGIEHEICGKVIVATKPVELPLLDALYERGIANGLAISKIGREELHEIEPHVNGLAAIRVPMAGIVNYKQVCDSLAALGVHFTRMIGGKVEAGPNAVLSFKREG